MANKQNLQIEISGYVTEIVCGHIPVPCKDAFTRHILANRNVADIPEWISKRNPDYVSPDHIKEIWYFEEEMMQNITKRCGHEWKTYRDIDNVCHCLGFGSGKGSIGLFEINILVDSMPVVEFVPFESPPETGSRLRNIENIRLTRLTPEPLPLPDIGVVAVSAGSWGKGAIRFSTELRDDFDEGGLELLVSDLTNLGVGEDHFVSGLRYAGKKLKGEVVKQGDMEMYQVSWYSHQKGKWLDMYEIDPSSL